MGREPSERAVELFKAALGHEGIARRAFLDKACAGDDALRAEVERLVATDARAGNFLAAPLQAAVAKAFLDDLPDALVGQRIGRYRIVRRIASGGMGTVYEAIQEQPARRVALKIVRSDLASPAVRQRFLHEAEILAHLRHPGIAQVFEAGSQAGVPFFAMEYLPGAKPITQHATDAQLSTRRRLELYAGVCDAVHHGHLRGVIHRDLKPGNILVDEAGQPKIIDFGVARATDGDLTITTLQTGVGQVLGTLRYMSPEQCQGDAAELDTRSDVYALGVVLYELLTGQLPYDVKASSPFEIPRIIRETQPRRPSSVNRLLRGDIETIVLKALAKDKAHRYQSAAELAADLRNYLRGDPIAARRDSTLYVLRKQVRRYRVPLAAAAAFVLLLIASSVVAWTLYLRSRQHLWDSYLAQARAQRWSGKPGQRLESLEALRKAAVIRPSAALRDEAIACLAIPDVRLVRRIDCAHNLQDVQLSTDARLRQMLLWDSTGETIVRRVQDNQDILTLPPFDAGRLGALPRVSFDGRFLACSSQLRCAVWEIESARLIASFAGHATDEIRALDFNHGASELAVGTADGTIVIHELESGVARTLPREHAPVHRMRYCPSAGTIATCSLNSHEVLIRDTRTGAVLQRLTDPSPAWNVAWSPDGRQLASACLDGHVCVWDVAAGRKQWTLEGHQHTVIAVGFDHTGALLFSASWDGTTRLWDPHLGRHYLTMPATGLEFAADAPLLGLRTHEQSLAFSVVEVVTSEAFRTLVAWPADVSDQICEWTSVSPDGQWVLSARAGVRLWDLRNEKALAYLPIGFTESALVHPSGRALITVGEAGVLLWPLRREAEVLRIGPPENLVPESHKRPCHAALSADGRTLVVAANDGAAQVLDLEKRDAVRSVGPHENMFFVAASPDGRWAATGTWGGTGVKVWDLRRAALARELPIPAPAKVAWSPDGKWLVTSETEYVIWDTETWHAIARFPRPNYMGVPGPIAFAPDGRILALVGDDPEIELRDLATFAVIARLACPLPIPVRSLAFTPDGERLFLPNPKGHIVHCWDLRAVRGPLATMGLDWNLPAYAARPVNDPVSPLRAEVDLGPLAP